MNCRGLGLYLRADWSLEGTDKPHRFYRAWKWRSTWVYLYFYKWSTIKICAEVIRQTCGRWRKANNPVLQWFSSFCCLFFSQTVFFSFWSACAIMLLLVLSIGWVWDQFWWLKAAGRCRVHRETRRLNIGSFAVEPLWGRRTCLPGYFGQISFVQRNHSYYF